MFVGDEGEVARSVLAERKRRGWSQEDLAERARVSTKTLQRMEAGRAVSARSRRDVLEALEIEPPDHQPAAPGKSAHLREAGPAAAGCWRLVDEALDLFEALRGARKIEVEVDEGARSQEIAAQPWYRRKLVFATKDPLQLLLELIDDAGLWRQASASETAAVQRSLANLLRALDRLEWSAAMRSSDRGVDLYFGSHSEVQRRTAA